METETTEQPKRNIGYWLRLIVVFIITLVLMLNIVLGIQLAYGIYRPPRSEVCCQTPDTYAGLEYEDVAFNSRDGLEIAGWYIPSQNRAAVILSHSFGANRAMTLPVGAILAEEGYGVLMIDLRAHGESGGETFTLWQAGDDVLDAVDYLQTRPDIDPEQIGVWGFSAGASASVHAAAQSEDIRVVVADGLSWTRFKDARGVYQGATYQYLLMDWVQLTYTDLFLSGGSKPRALIDDVVLISPRPLLIIAAGDSNHEELAAKRYQATGGDSVDIWVVPGTKHGGGWNQHPEDYRQHLLEHFSLLVE